MGDVTSSLVTYAETVSPWEAKAFGSAQVAGRISKLLVRPGDIVSKGQVVAELTSRELENVRLAYLQAKNDLALNQKLLDSTRPVALEGAVPRQRLEEIENAYAQSENDLELAKIRAATLGLDAKQFDTDQMAEAIHLIRSPIAGKIIHSDLTEGKFVEAFEHLFEIVNLDTVWVRIQVLEKDIQQVSVGQKVELTLPEAQTPTSTTVDRIDVAFDPQGQVCWAWATITQSSISSASVSQPIMPGLVGSAKIQLSSESKRLSVPVKSIYSDGLQSYVFVEEASTKASSEYRKRNIKLGKRSASLSGATHIEVDQGDLYPVTEWL